MKLNDLELQAHLEQLAMQYDQLPEWLKRFDKEQDAIEKEQAARYAEMLRMRWL